MKKDIEVRVIVPQKHTTAEFDSVLGFDRPQRRLFTAGNLYDTDSLYCDVEDCYWDGPEWTPIDHEDF